MKLIKEKQFRRKLCSVITFFCIFLFMCESGKKNQEQISFTEQSFSFICETEWYFVHSQEKNLLFLCETDWKNIFVFSCETEWKKCFHNFPKKVFILFFYSFTQKNLYFSRYFILVKMKKKIEFFFMDVKKKWREHGGALSICRETRPSGVGGNRKR